MPPELNKTTGNTLAINPRSNLSLATRISRFYLRTLAEKGLLINLGMCFVIFANGLWRFLPLQYTNLTSKVNDMYLLTSLAHIKYVSSFGLRDDGVFF